MLVRKLKPEDTIHVGDSKVYIVEVRNHVVTVGVTARPEVRITFERPQAHLEPCEAGEPSKEMD